MKSLLFFFLQTPDSNQKFLFQNGKFNTVTVVMAVIFLGIAGYLFWMNLKVVRLEKRVEEMKGNEPKSDSKG